MLTCDICLNEYGADAAEGHQCELAKENKFNPMILDTSGYIDSFVKSGGVDSTGMYHQLKVDKDGNVILSEESINAIVKKLKEELKK